MEADKNILPKSKWGFEYKTKTKVFGLPLVHIAFGLNHETGKPLVARGIIAIGIFAIGLITIAQFGIGILLGFGQFTTGIFAIGQFALGVYFGLGQFATGITAIGQFAFGKYVLAQFGCGKYAWTSIVKNPQALEYFRNILQK
jgi:hypothetical protein